MSSQCVASINKAYLNDHNVYRAKHNTPGLQFSAEITEIAQKYANYLAINDLFIHSGVKGLGENLALQSGGKPDLNNCGGLFNY